MGWLSLHRMRFEGGGRVWWARMCIVLCHHNLSICRHDCCLSILFTSCNAWLRLPFCFCCSAPSTKPILTVECQSKPKLSLIGSELRQPQKMGSRPGSAWVYPDRKFVPDYWGKSAVHFKQAKSVQSNLALTKQRGISNKEKQNIIYT